MKMRSLRLLSMLVAMTLACLLAAPTATAQSSRGADLLEAVGIPADALSPAAPAGTGGDAFGVIVASLTAPALGEATLVSGYAAPPVGIVYTWTGNAIEATEEGIVLAKNGTYQIHLEGALNLFQGDDTVHPRSSVAFFMAANGAPLPNSGCVAQKARYATFRPSPPGNPYTRIVNCTLTYTVQVRNRGSAAPPFVLGRGALIQAVAQPDAGFPLGDNTAWVVRMEVTRIGS